MVSPFVGERYADRDRLSDLLAPPYDVLSAKQRKLLEDKDEHNAVHITLPRGGDEKYEKVKRLISEWRAGGVLTPDDGEGVYVVRQEYRAGDGCMSSSSGVIGAVTAEPYSNGRIRPHVKTHSEPKADRLSLLRATNSMLDALLFLARDADGHLGELIDEVESSAPTSRAVLDDVSIKVWRVSGKRGGLLAEAAGDDVLYLADGHHRYEAVLAYRKECPAARRLLGLVHPLGKAGVSVLPTHRLLYGGHADVAAVIEGVQGRFQVHELTPGTSFVEHLDGLRDRGTACVVVQRDGSAYSLLLKAGAKLGDLPFANEPTVASLDVTRVDEMVVKPLVSTLGKQGQLAYSADPDHVIDEVVNGAGAAAVMLNPATVEQVLAVADAGAVMPQKATYFVPKVPSGIVGLSWKVEQATS